MVLILRKQYTLRKFSNSVQSGKFHFKREKLLWGKDLHDLYYAPNVSTIVHGGRNAWGRRET